MSEQLNQDYSIKRYFHDLSKIGIGGQEQAIPLIGMLASIALATPGIAHLVADQILHVSVSLIDVIAMGAAGIFAYFFAKSVLPIFHQTNRFYLADDKQFWRNFQSSIPFESAPDDILIGYTTDQGLPIRIPKKLLGHHAYGFGTTGSGKTGLGVLVIGFQQILNGGGFGFIDGKLDSKTQKLLYWFACLCGRREDFLLVNPADANSSNTWNPILYGDKGSVVSKIMTLYPPVEGAAEHYRSLIVTALNNIIGAIKCLDRPYSFEDLSLILVNPKALMQLERWVSVPEHKNKDDVKSFLIWKQGYEKMIEGDDVVKVNVSLLKKEFSGIVARMSMFTNGSFKYVCNSYDPEINLIKNILERKIVYVALPTMGKPEEARILGKMFVSDLRGAIAEIQNMPEEERPGWAGSATTPANPLFIWELDEFGSYAEGGDADKIFEQGRSAGIIGLPMSQTLANLTQVKEGFDSQVLGNCHTKIICRIEDQETAEYLSDFIDTTRRVMRGEGMGEGESEGSKTLIVTPQVNANQTSNETDNLREIEENYISAADIKAIPEGTCLVVSKGRVFHVKIPHVTIPEKDQKLIGELIINHRKPRHVNGLNLFGRAL